MRVWIVVGGLLLVGAGVLIWTIREPTPAEANQVQASVIPGEAPALPKAAVTTTEPRRENASVSSTAIDFEKEFTASDDLYEFVKKTLVEANRGNGAAQYYVSITLSECAFYYKAYFVIDTGPATGERRRTYDEALQYAAERNGQMLDFVAPILKRCQRLIETRDESLGTAEGWMRDATANGFPRAQAQTAMNVAFQGRNSKDPKESQALLDEARGLVLAAVRSKDPGAIALVGDAASWLQENGAERNQWVWLLAACQRGLDCSRESGYYRLRCGYDAQCQPYETGVVDVIRRSTGDDFAELERRAREINEKIDQDRFDELGL